MNSWGGGGDKYSPMLAFVAMLSLLETGELTKQKTGYLSNQDIQPFYTN